MSRTLKINFSNNQIELIKWLALFFMLGDHVNKYLFNYTLPYLHEAGRLAMPLFGLVLAYNLARPSVDQLKRNQIIKKLVVFGLVSTPIFIALGNVYFIWPLNILFTLAGSTAAIAFMEKKKYFISSLIIISTSITCEFFLPACLLIIFSYYFFKTEKIYWLIFTVISVSSLTFINENFYALMVIPLIIAVKLIDVPLIRIRNFFYYAYPLHLGLLIVIRIPMSHAGYLFFL